MLLVQNNCGKGFDATTTALQNAIKLGAGIVCIQEPFIGKRDIQHAGFLLMWPEGERYEARVLIAVRKDTLNQIVIDKKSDLVSHPYIIAIDVRKCDPNNKELGRLTKIVNVYDQNIGRGYTYSGGSETVRRAIQDVSWGPIIRSRTILIGDFNAHRLR